MRDFVKLLIVGVVLFMAPQVFAESYKVLIVPDNIVTESIAVDSYIYDSCAEFFADGVTSILNKTESITSPPVSEIRSALKKESASMLSAKALTSRFKTSYNIDYSAVKKIAQKNNSRYVLLITSSVDAQNYILRRTFWDFLNIPGASVVDPAYKISTYAVLIDTLYNRKLWDDTYYKTISVCENRIITRGPSPQTEQLEKIRDYSNYLCPQIARNIQLQLLPPDSAEIVEYGIGDIDNVFTKKYRHLGKETKKVYNAKKEQVNEFRAVQQEKKALKEQAAKEQQTELKVKATPIIEPTTEIKKINYTKIKQTEPEPVKYYPAINKTLDKTTEPEVDYKSTSKNEIKNDEGINLNIKRRKHNLFGDYTTNQPELRDYSK